MAWQVKIKSEYDKDPEIDELYNISDIPTTRESKFTKSDVEAITIERVETVLSSEFKDTESPVATFTPETLKMEVMGDNESISSEGVIDYTTYYNTLSRSSFTDEDQITEQSTKHPKPLPYT